MKHKIDNPLVFNFYYALFSLILIIPIPFFITISSPTSYENLLLASGLKAISSVLFVVALKKLDITTISPLFNLRSIFSTILAVFILGEFLSPIQYVLLSVIVFASFFVTSSSGKPSLKSFLSTPVLIFVFQLLILSISSIFINKGINELGYWNFSFWNQILLFAFTTLTIPFFVRQIRVSVKALIPIGVVASLFFVAILLENYSYSKNVTITTMILNLPGSMILAILLSKVYPKLLERNSNRVYAIRLIAAIIMFVTTIVLIQLPNKNSLTYNQNSLIIGQSNSNSAVLGIQSEGEKSWLFFNRVR